MYFVLVNNLLILNKLDFLFFYGLITINIRIIMKKIKLLSLLLCSFAITQAQAQTTITAPMNISATVASTCTLSATPIAFGTINLNGPAPSANSTLTINCTKGTPYSISANGGLNYANNTRSMKNSANTDILNYVLYIVSGTQLPVNTSFTNGTGTGIATTLTMYSSIPPLQNVSAGSYSDIVTLSITY
jgi:spore coat protein U-like protein